MDQKHNLKFSPATAYIIGLITTDGCLSKDKRHIDFTSKDLQLIKTFKKCLGLKNKISKKSNLHQPNNTYYHLQFGDVKFYNHLIKLGLKQKKSKTLGKIKIPKKYFRDFLRGHLDGDGSIVNYIDRYMSYRNKRYKYRRLYLTFYSAAFKHISWIQKNIYDLLNIKGSLLGWKNKEAKSILWKLRFAKYDSLNVLSWLYYKPNLPCLNRKRKIAEYFLTNFHQHNK